MAFCGALNCFPSDEDSLEDITDSSSASLSYVGLAAYNALKSKHECFRHSQWNVSSGKPVGKLQQTPGAEIFHSQNDPPPNHSDWFLEKLKEVMIKTTTWCDLMTLTPPTGVFITIIKEALLTICETAQSKEKPIIVRMMFGEVIASPFNCDQLINDLTSDLPKDANVELWVGSWRKGVSWNHAKMIAVDGKYLHTGGHNLWDEHYLINNPVHDLSIEMEGRVTHDGHLVSHHRFLFHLLFERI